MWRTPNTRLTMTVDSHQVAGPNLKAAKGLLAFVVYRHGLADIHDHSEVNEQNLQYFT